MQGINRKKIHEYFIKLNERGENLEVINRKIRAIDKFIYWAYKQNLIGNENYQQIKAEIDNIVKSKIKNQNLKLKFKIKKLINLPKEAINKIKSKFSKVNLKKNQISNIEYPTSYFNIFKYIGFLSLIIFISLLSFGLYNRFFEKQERTFAFPQNLTRAGRLLSFQGRLTDSLGNPITTATNVTFRLYNVSTGGTALYTAGPCSITPDQDGIFSVLIGGSGYSPTPPQSVCGTEIPASIFTENANVYMGVTVGADSEMTPRQQIANVGYAINAETLQGFPPGTGTSNIPFINQDGNLLIAVANPGVRSTYASADFTISSAKTAILQSASIGDVVLQATESGVLKFRTGGNTDVNNRLTISNTGVVAIPSLSTGVLQTNAIGEISSNLGTANYIPKWTNLGLSNTSSIYDDGTNVGIGTISPNQKLSVAGSLGIIEGGVTPTYYTIFQGGDQSGNITYTLPTSIVANGFLTTDASGILSWTNTLPTTVTWSNITDPTANLTLNHGTYTTTFNTSATTGTFFTINANSLTSGKGLYLSSTSTGLTGNLAEFVLSGSNAGNTGNVVRIAQTGTSSPAVPLMVTNVGTGASFIVNDETGDNDATPFLIDASGNVGIGTTGPQGLLEIKSVANDGVSNFANGLVFGRNVSPLQGNNWGHAAIWTVGSSGWRGNLVFGTDDDGSNNYNIVERMRITSGGNVGIGTTSPSGKLHVLDSVDGTGVNLTSIFERRDPNTPADNFGGAIGLHLGRGDLGVATESARLAAIMTSVANRNADLALYSLNAGTLSEAVRIQSSGNVGIGTANPSSFKLEVAGHLGPNSTNSYDLGSSSLQWRNLYAQTIYQNGSSLDSLYVNVTGDTMTGTLYFAGGTNYYVDNLGNARFLDLVVDDTANPGLTVGDGSIGFVNIGSSTIFDNNTSYLSLDPNSDLTPEMVITDTGNVGIGTTNPGAKLEVVGRVYQSGLGYSTFFGYQAGANDDLSNNYNTAVGYQALYSNTTGLGNVALGYRAGYNLTTGSRNIIIGYDIYAPSATADYQLNIGNIIFGTNINGTGTTISTGNIGIGTTGPQDKLHVSGSIRIPSGGYGINNENGRRIFDTGYNATFGDYSAISTGFDWEGNTGAYEPMSVVAGGNAIFFTRGNATTHAPYDTILMKIQDNGNVGIGTTTPNSLLDVRGRINTQEIAFRNADGGDDSDPYRLRKYKDASNVNWLELQLNDDSNEEFRIYGNSCAGYGCGEYSGNLYHFFRADGTAYHAGNVGIGTTTPGYKLHAEGTGYFSGRLYVGSSTGVINIGTSVYNDGGLSGFGINFDRDSGHRAYGFFRESGAWTHPYPDLVWGAHTGAKIVTHGNYGGLTILEDYNWTQANWWHWGGPGTEIARFRHNNYGGSYFLSNVGIGTTGPQGLLEIKSVDNDGVSNFANGLVFGRNVSPLQGNNWGHAAIWTVGSSGWRGNLVFGTDDDGSNNYNIVERMRITSGGNVGIGTTNPGYKLDVVGNMAATIMLDRDNTGYYVDPAGTSRFAAFDVGLKWRFADTGGDDWLRIYNTSGTGYYGGVAADKLWGGTYVYAPTYLLAGIMYDFNNTSYYVDPGGTSNLAGNLYVAGNVGIGTTAPSNQLTIYNSTWRATLSLKGAGDYWNYTDLIFERTNASNHWGLFYRRVTNDNRLALSYFDGTNYIPSTNWYTNGNMWIAGTLQQGSDIRLKKDIKSLDNALEKILNLKPVSFKWKYDNSYTLGFIAQDVEVVLPELTTTDKSTGYKSINYIGIIPVLTKAIQEQQLQISSLSTQLTNFEKDLTLNTSGNLAIMQINAGSENNANEGEYVYEGVFDIENQISNIKNQNYIVKIKNDIVERISAFAEIFTAKIKAGLIETENTIVNNVLAAKKVFAENLIAQISNIEYIISKNISVREKIISPIIETINITATGTAQLNTIATNEIKPQNDQIIINLSNNPNSPNWSNTTNSENKGPLAQLIIKGLEGKTAAVIDEAGNATFSGTLTANQLKSNQLTSQEATIEGKLIAKEVEAENIVRLKNDLNSLFDQTNQSNQAFSQSINEIQRLLADIINTPLPDLNNQTNLSNTASLNKLTVTGFSNLYNVTISNSLLVGATLFENNTIISLASELKLSALEKINLFDGAVIIAKDGTMTTKGTLIAQGGIHTNTIKPISNNLSIQLDQSDESVNNKLQITNNGKEMAYIDASGSAYFQGLSLNKAATSSAIISASENFIKSGLFAPAIETASSSAGTGTLPENQKEVIIYNNNVSEDSLIYITPLGINYKPISVAEKKKGYFRIVTESTNHPEIKFDWLIIN